MHHQQRPVQVTDPFVQTSITDVVDALREASSGYVIPLIPYGDEEQVIRWANVSHYGLGSSVWTSDIERGVAMARRIEAGMTFINTHSFESLDISMPFDGIRQSGLRREFGDAGMREYVEEHAIRVLK
ncbi:aldehyde dehydrogenase family protein [Streptomyces sp. NPDC001601]|uniref:aldehyde dehydrogenase family protein n=1 Tax=Streptomyces sp. NPDC001601 TaxID=3364592 RepID=UPI0036C89416